VQNVLGLPAGQKHINFARTFTINPQASAGQVHPPCWATLVGESCTETISNSMRSFHLAVHSSISLNPSASISWKHLVRSFGSSDQTPTSGVGLEAMASGSQSLRLGEKNRKTRAGQLLKRGVYRNYAVTTGCACKGPWRMSKVKWVNIALPDKHFESLGLSFPWS